MDAVPLRLTNKRLGDILVPLGKKLTSKPFEETLKRHWKALMNTTGRCVFIMEEVEWASLTEIAMLTMWLSRLKSHDKEIAVCLPYCGILSGIRDSEQKVDRRRAVCSFLSRLRFIEILQSMNIKIYGVDQFYFSWTELDDPRYCRSSTSFLFH